MHALTAHTNRPLTQKPKLFASLAFWLAVVSPLQAAPATACQDALTLPLDHSIVGYVPVKEAKRYAIEVERSGFVIIEARGAGQAPLTVSFLGSDCMNTDSNLPVPTIHGRHLHQVQGPDTYFVEIAAGDVGETYQLTAWWVDDSQEHRLPTKEDMAESDEFTDCLPTKEDMAESDEFTGCLPTKEDMAESDEFAGCLPTKEDMAESDEFTGCLPTKEDMAESDEFAGCLPTKEDMAESDEFAGDGSLWQEIAGHGLLEITRSSRGLETRFHSLCPWARRPDLLSTFTCAPRLRLATSGMVTMRSPAGEGSRLIGVMLTASGRLAVEAVDDPSAKTVVFDAEGGFAGELTDDTVWLEAGDYFFETEAGNGPIRIYAELD